MKVTVTCVQMARDIDVVRPAAERLGLKLHLPRVVQQLEGRELVEALQGAVGIIAGDDQITAEVMDASPDLKVISKWGIGTDGIDKEAAAARGIAVANTPHMFDDEVADVALGYLIMLTRQLHTIDRGVRAGAWPKPVGASLAGTTLGIVGLGGTGRSLARRALVMGMTVVGTDPDPNSRGLAAALGVETASFEELLPRVDHIALHCPLTPSTRHLIGHDALAATRPGLRVVNTARGPLIDESALIVALESEHVVGAALDVFEAEPLSPTSPLRQFENVIFGAHNASNTREASLRTHWAALDNLLAGLGLTRP